MAKQIKIQPTPNITGQPVVEFNKAAFEATIWNKGLNCLIESAIKCPCKTDNNSHQTTCKNCQGIGWVLINPVQDRVIVSGINSETQYKEWSAEKLGTISMSFARRDYELGYMDRVTIVDSLVPQSEVLYPFGFSDNFFAYTIYPIESVIEVFQFESVSSKLKLLVEDTDYTFDGYKLLFTNTPVVDVTALKAITGYETGNKSLVNSTNFYNFDATSTATPDDNNVVLPDDITLPDPGRWLKLPNFTVSVRYRHKLQYFILDIPHVIRNSYRKNSLGRDELQKLPLNAIGRLVHWVIDKPNFAEDNIFDNSYQII